MCLCQDMLCSCGNELNSIWWAKDVAQLAQSFVDSIPSTTETKHAYNPRIQEVEAGGIRTFKFILGYTASSGLTCILRAYLEIKR